AANDAMRRAAEGNALLGAIPDRSRMVLLDVEGTAWSSPEFAAQLDGWRRDARDCTFVVGGAAGVAPAVRRRADVAWSLGRLTLPHELARVVLVEQLYRASTILRG
ncbi:MAG: 23S rRNA (pseudouridine(1915)-N(3))-methyltransferase RlmH, partial [Gemmatimonadales bacterium]